MATTIKFLQKSSNGTPVTNLDDSRIEDVSAQLMRTSGSGAQETRLETTTVGENPFYSIFENAVRKGIFQYSAVNVEAVIGTTFGDLAFQSGVAGVAATNGMIQFADGTVGIGKTAVVKLDVNGSINSDAAITATGTLTALNCFATSDERLKTDIKPYLPDYGKIKKLTNMLKSYKWKDTGKSDIGFMAQDIKKLFPEFVTKGDDGMLAVNYQKLVLMLVIF